MSQFEVPLGQVPRAYIYKIPPAKTTKGHKASDWDLENPINKENPFSIHVIERNDQCIIKVMDPVNDQLFVECVYTPYSVEKTLDSSRYFVLVPTDERGRRAFIGLGFQERSESFDFEQALLSYDRFQSSKKEIEIMQKDWEENKQDLSLKEGEKIKINFGNKFSKKDKSTQDEDSSNFSMLLPPTGDVKKGPQEKEGSNISMLLPPPPGDNVTGSLNNSSGDFFQQSGEWSSFDTSNNDSEEWTQF